MTSEVRKDATNAGRGSGQVLDKSEGHDALLYPA